VVDAKTPLDAYLSAIEATDDAQRDALLARHAAQIRTQVQNLSSKSYAAQLDRAPEFVVLFIPGESFLQAALQQQPDLMNYAMERNVIIATPRTLLSLLRAVHEGWREERLAENAQRISELGVELHKRLCTALEHLGRLGKSLDSTVSHYNKFVGSIESQVITQAKRFEELSVRSSKQIPEAKQIETSPRETTKAEE